jgi:hypothetical protein
MKTHCGGLHPLSAAIPRVGESWGSTARMPFSRYVEIGRIALINYGEEYGKLVVISDVVDQNRVSFLYVWIQ